MAHQKHDKRDTAAKHGTRENFFTEGGIETPVQAFADGNPDPLRVGPFHATYGNHKKMGSEMLPTRLAGRGGSGKSIEGKLNRIIFKGPGRSS